MYKYWKDHVTQYDNRFKEIQNSDGTITHEAVEGEVIQEGTPQNARNFNDIEERLVAANETAALATIQLKQANEKIRGLVGEIIKTTLTNAKIYPFNSSLKTLALATPRDTLDYVVDVEAVAVGSGAVGEVVITDKQLNGFKIAHTGSASEVSVKCIVKGGCY